MSLIAVVDTVLVICGYVALGCVLYGYLYGLNLPPNESGSIEFVGSHATPSTSTVSETETATPLAEYRIALM